ncbi:hypothetical protein ABZ626_38720 [Streptomyces longispororuber]|uniref:hypothetical protein n=1 Tax=Streptomyces longispororuber TaxID=68230 RepID=UPI00341020A6
MTSTTGSGPLLAQRHVTRLLFGTLIGRLPNGMAPVALLLLVADQGYGSTSSRSSKGGGQQHRDSETDIRVMNPFSCSP